MSSFDMPFYESEVLRKPALSNRRPSENDWKEENIDLDGLMRQQGQNSSSNQDHCVPTFLSAANVSRPSVLNINIPTSSKNIITPARENQVSPHQQSPHLPQRSRAFDYPPSNPAVSPSYNSHSPVSMNSPHSPYTPPQQSPASPHQRMMGQPSAGAHMSPAPLSPYSRPGSVSPANSIHGPMAHGSMMPAAVFGRYTDYMSGYSSCDDPARLSPSFDKNEEHYRAKRARNNIAVRRSREKKKQREIENEDKVKELSEENQSLQARLGSVIKEVNMLKSLYKTVGVSLPPDAQLRLNKELAKIS